MTVGLSPTSEVPPHRIPYVIEATCPRCDAPLDEVTVGRPVAGTEINAILRCSVRCVPQSQYLLSVSLRPFAYTVTSGDAVLRAQTPARCGTEAGFQRHVRAREKPCRDCGEAHQRYANPEQTGRGHPGTAPNPEWERRRIESRKELAAILAEIGD